jgi:hypothetical protein
MISGVLCSGGSTAARSMLQWLITTECMEGIRMATKRAFQPVNPIHPGEMLLEEFLRPAGKTQTEFAQALGWTKARRGGARSGGGTWYLAATMDEPAGDLRPRRGGAQEERGVARVRT